MPKLYTTQFNEKIDERFLCPECKAPFTTGAFHDGITIIAPHCSECGDQYDMVQLIPSKKEYAPSPRYIVLFIDSLCVSSIDSELTESDVTAVLLKGPIEWQQRETFYDFLTRVNKQIEDQYNRFASQTYFSLHAREKTWMELRYNLCTVESVLRHLDS